MVTAKPLGQLKKAGVVASFVTLARHNRLFGGGVPRPLWIQGEVRTATPESEKSAILHRG